MVMENWYEKSIKALQLNGMAERTQEGYTRAVRMLVEHFDKTPDLITEEELQEYFLHRKNVCKWSPNTMRICYSGIKFFAVTFRVS
jgi:integrase/recombinase XerD